jgi:hypothetical protein
MLAGGIVQLLTNTVKALRRHVFQKAPAGVSLELLQTAGWSCQRMIMLLDACFRGVDPNGQVSRYRHRYRYMQEYTDTCCKTRQASRSQNRGCMHVCVQSGAIRQPTL